MRHMSGPEFDKQKEHQLQLVRTYGSVTVSNEGCARLIAQMIRSAAYSVRIALYCLGNDKVVAAIINACSRLKDLGKVVLIVDDNEHNAKAIETLEPVFKATGNILKIWHQPGKKELFHACLETAKMHHKDPAQWHLSKCFNLYLTISCQERVLESVEGALPVQA